MILQIDQLTHERRVIDWPCKELVLGHTPDIITNDGRVPLIANVSVQSIYEPPQLWIDYVDTETGRRWYLAFEDDYLANQVNVRLRRD